MIFIAISYFGSLIFRIGDIMALLRLGESWKVSKFSELEIISSKIVENKFVRFWYKDIYIYRERERENAVFFITFAN